MAKKFIDASLTNEKELYELGDGTALTLTNSVRVLYDDTLEPAALHVVLTRIRDRLTAGNVPDAV